jgi:hypothetical protein
MKAEWAAKRGRGRLVGQLGALFAMGLAGTGCLPGDERPAPGSIFVTAEPSGATAGGFTTADGWTVQFYRFVTALGDVRLHGESGEGGPDFSGGSCTEYAETHYDWLFDFTVAEREKVGLVFGLGTCSVEWSFRPPSSDSVLGPGATQEDIVRMRTEGADLWIMEPERVAVVVQGQAERGGVIKRFDWAFRTWYEVDECPGVSGEDMASVVELRGGDERTLRIEVRGEELFRLAPLDDAPLQFDGFAEADSDGNGFIFMEELGHVHALPGSIPPGVEPPFGTDTRLGDVVYGFLLPRITRLVGSGECHTELESRWW